MFRKPGSESAATAGTVVVFKPELVQLGAERRRVPREDV